MGETTRLAFGLLIYISIVPHSARGQRASASRA